MLKPRIHRTPSEAVRVRLREVVTVGGVTFGLERPGESDQLFDHPKVREAYEADEFIPYWTELWPAAWLLAQAILDEPWENYPQPVEVLELACGLGLPGLAALHRGLWVTFSDIDELAIDFATQNATLNGFIRFDRRAIDLRSPPKDLQAKVIFGADLLYEPRLLQALIPFLKSTLAPEGVCLIADPDRLTARPFHHLTEAAGLAVQRTPAQVMDSSGANIFGAIYRITHQRAS
jgi:predicted nicotinamide N-methyase